MNLKSLAAKPKLIKLTIDDKDLVEKYGEAIDFYIYDRYDMNTFMKLAVMEEGADMSQLTDLVEDLIMDEKGVKLTEADGILPMDIMLKVVETTVNSLGNAVSQASSK
jgi:hypothetical protein